MDSGCLVQSILHSTYLCSECAVVIFRFSLSLFSLLIFSDSCSSVLQENLDGHLKRCPFVKQALSLSNQPFYRRGINGGKESDEGVGNERGSLTPAPFQDFGSLDGLISGSLDNVSSEMKRNAVQSMAVSVFLDLIKKIESVHGLVCKDIVDSYKIPEACNVWIKREVDRYFNSI